MKIEATVSVVIPTYNRANLVRFAIESALHQSHRILEVIVVDDASTDETQNVVTEISDDRVVYIKMPFNVRGAVARNVGISKARGEYIAFLDSDDTWEPTKIHDQLKIMSVNGREICFTNILICGGPRNGREWNRRAPQDGEKIVDYLFRHRQAVQTSTMLMHSSIASEIRFDESLSRHQDWDFVLRAAQIGISFKYVDKALVRYRFAHGTNLSLGPDLEPTVAWIRALQDTFPQDTIGMVKLHALVPRMFKKSVLSGVVYLAKMGLAQEVGGMSILFGAYVNIVPWRVQNYLNPYLSFIMRR